MGSQSHNCDCRPSGARRMTLECFAHPVAEAQWFASHRYEYDGHLSFKQRFALRGNGLQQRDACAAQRFDARFDFKQIIHAPRAEKVASHAPHEEGGWCPAVGTIDHGARVSAQKPQEIRAAALGKPNIGRVIDDRTSMVSSK